MDYGNSLLETKKLINRRVSILSISSAVLALRHVFRLSACYIHSDNTTAPSVFVALPGITKEGSRMDLLFSFK